MAQEDSAGKASGSGGGKGLATLALLLAVVALALAGASMFLAPAPAPAAPQPGDRVINVLAVEYKGTAGAGEKIPNGSKVSAYAWEPGTITVNKGDRVTLKIYGVNGGAHPSTIQGYDDLTFKVYDPSGKEIESGSKTFNVYRGHTTEVKFTASKAGYFTIGCAAHQPTMNAVLQVVG